MPITPLIRQFTVAGTTQLAALSAGGMIAYPGVLLQQLQANDSIVKLDLHKGSWIGSVHGIAGIPSIFTPLLMQYRGRKCAFILSCMSIIIGWTLCYFSQSITTLIIGECFHGFGGNSLLVVSSLSIAEMVQPKYRNTCILLKGTVQAFGISAVGILGKFMHWKNVALVMCFPLFLALPIAFFWPESPSWLACKGKFEECERTFKRLRGSGDAARKELNSIVSCRYETSETMKRNQSISVFERISRRDFYMPALHTIVLLNVIYWGGGMPMIIYGNDMIQKSSSTPNPRIKMYMDCILFIGYNITTVLVRYCSSKKVMLFSLFFSMIFVSLAATVTYLQSVGKIPNDSQLAVYLLLGFILFLNLGSTSIGFTTSSEIMPVKHRGIGGSLFVLCTCVFHSSSLKAYPYLCIYINIWGVFLVYAACNLFFILFIWKYVPETRNRTLHEIEQFYNYGYFKDSNVDDVRVPFIEDEDNKMVVISNKDVR